LSEIGGVLRVFVDSNVLIEGLFAPWSASRAILILARADWLVTANTEHFNEEVAARTALQIATPREFLTRCRIGA
jgi:predicted nucleic acid-binding protein